MGIEQWSTVAASNVTANTGILWDEGQAPSSVNNSARDTLAAIREWYEDAEWLKLGENGSATAYSISYVSATVFKFAGTDRRTLASIGRRVKAGVGLGVITGTIGDVSLSASDTQVTVTWDSGQLDGSLSFVSMGIANSVSGAAPVVRDNRAHFAGATDPTKRLRFEVDGFTTATERVVTPPDKDMTLGTVLGTEVASTSGTAVTFTGIPAGVRTIRMLGKGVSTSGTNEFMVQIGDAGGLETADYTGAYGASGSAAVLVDSDGWNLTNANAAAGTYDLFITLSLENATTNNWHIHAVLARTDSASLVVCTGSKALSAVLTQVSLTTDGSSDTFDAGVVNITYEF